SRTSRRVGERAPDSVAAPARRWPLVPFDLQGLLSLERGPGALGHHRHAARDLDHALHAWHGEGRGGLERLHAPAEHGAARHRGVHHAGDPHVAAEDRLAADLVRRVHARHPFSENAELGGRLERRVRRHRERGGPWRQVAVAEPAAGRHVLDHAVSSAARLAWHVPGKCRRADQHLAGGRARVTQRLEAGSNAGRYNPTTRPAPAAAPVLRNSRRLTVAWLMSHLWSAGSAEPTTGVTTASIIRWRGSLAGRRGRSFFGRPEHGLLAFALTPPLRRHSDPEDRHPGSVRHPTTRRIPSCSVSIPSHSSSLGSALPRAGSPRWQHAAKTASAAP